MSENNQKNSWLVKLGQALSGEPQDRQQLLSVLREAQSRHLIDVNALTMIEGVFEVSEMQVRDIMIPRTQMVVVNKDAELDDMLPVVVESAHSRFPVVGEKKDEVIGIMMAKDLLSFVLKLSKREFSVREILRPAVYIPESKRLDVLLHEFRANRNHMAIVVDEYGIVAGLVTIEDVLEQIVGEIVDEHDVEEGMFIMKHSETSYTVKALTTIEDFNEYFDSQFSDDEFDTIGGLVMHEFGYLPKRGETCKIGIFQYKVLHADSRRLHLLQMTILQDDNISSPKPSLKQAD